MKHLAAVIATCCSIALVGGLLVGLLGGSALWAFALGALLIMASLRQLFFHVPNSRVRGLLLLRAAVEMEQAGEFARASELFRRAAEECLRRNPTKRVAQMRLGLGLSRRVASQFPGEFVGV
jgi:uncharacterized membrane protein YbhN (UPF0104 family)